MALLCCWFTAQAPADELPWLISLPEAMAQAKRENKLVLLDFTGSDWCPCCKALDAQTFSRPEFSAYAAKSLVLVQVDFPRHKPQSAELKEANNVLKETYEIHAYPTLVVLKQDGTVAWKQVGLLPGGPSAMIAKLNGLNPRSSAETAAGPIQWTNPTPTPRKEGDEPKLQAIFYSASHRSVILDGKTCEEGDTVHKMRVVKIAPDKVTVVWNGSTKDLKLN